MKVLFVNTLYPPHVVGGAERSVQLLAETLSAEGDHAVVVTTAAGTGRVASNVNGVSVHAVGIKNLYWPFSDSRPSKVLKPAWHLLDAYNPLMAAALGRLLDEHRPDVVHTNNLMGFSAAAWAQAKRRNIPIVHSLRDYYLLCPRSTLFRAGSNCESRCLDCRALSAPKRWATDAVGVVVGISRHILERHLSEGLFRNAHHKEVIFNSVAPRTPRTEFNGAAAVRYGFMGRVEQEKGIEILLAALQQLPSQAVSLVVAGRGDTEYLRRLQQRYPLPNVSYRGFSRPEDFFAEIDVQVVPSLWQEPLSRAVIEGFSFGVPVIGAQRGGIPELIDVGRTGYVFDPDVPGSLVTAMTRFLDAPSLVASMRAACVLKSEEFAPSRIIAAYRGAYRAALDGR